MSPPRLPKIIHGSSAAQRRLSDLGHRRTVTTISPSVADAAAPGASLGFLFYGGVVVLPVIAAYTIGVYWGFRGKVRTSSGGMP